MGYRCLQEIVYLTSSTTLNPLSAQSRGFNFILGGQGQSENRPRMVVSDGEDGRDS